MKLARTHLGIVALILLGLTLLAIPVRAQSNTSTLSQDDIRTSGHNAAVALGIGDPITINPNAYYRIIAKHSGKALDVYGLSQDNFASIVQHTPHIGDNQRWRIQLLGDGYYKITAKHSGKSLDVNGLSQDNFAPIIQHAFHGGDNQRWRIESLGNGYGRIIAKHSGKALDVYGLSQNDFAAIVQHTPHIGDNQQWRFELVEYIP